MNKKRISFIITISSTFALGLSAIGIVAVKNAKVKTLRTQADEYTLILEDPFFEGSGPSEYGTKTFETELGNEVKFGYDKLYQYQEGYTHAYATGMNCMRNGSYFSIIANSEGNGIAGINYVKVYADNDTYGTSYVWGYYGWEEGAYADSQKIQYSDGTHEYTFYFDNVQPTFAKIAVTSTSEESRFGVHKIEINYSCVETVNPYVQAGDFFLTEREDHYSVSKYTGTDTDLIFPDRYNDQPVTEIDNYFATTMIEKSAITSVVIPDGYTRIGQEAFRNAGFTTISLPNTMKRIEERAFAESGIKTCNFPASIEYIGTSAFFTSELTAIDLSATSLTYIYDNAFNNTKATTLQLPNGIETIGSGAFYNCKFTSLVIPNTITDIYGDGFGDIDECESLTFEDGGTEPLNIGGAAFRSIGHVGVLKLPERMTEMTNAYTFLDCKNLTAFEFINGGTTSTDGRVWVNDGVLYSGNPVGSSYVYLVAYPGAKTTSNLIIPENVTHVADYGGAGYAQFESVTFTNVNHSIYCTAYSFDGCKNLRTLNFSGGEVKVRWYAFRGAAFRQLVLPENVTVLRAGFNQIGSTEDPLSLYLETAAIPNTWDEDWDYDEELDSGALKLYFFSAEEPATAEEKATHWRYVDGNPTPWNA